MAADRYFSSKSHAGRQGTPWPPSADLHQVYGLIVLAKP
jgi:hypothetical protein